MVSKVAVVALVAIVACPILLGYAMNLNEITVTEYKSNNDPMNVTQLLQTGTDWSIANGDPYTMNSKGLATFVVGSQIPAYPIFNKVSSVKTSTPMYQSLSNWNGGSDGGVITTLQEYQFWCDYVVSASRTVTLTVYYNNGGNYYTFYDVVYVRYSALTEKITVYSSHNYNNPNSHSINTLSVPNISLMDYTVTGGALPIVYNYIPKTAISSYADIADGYYFKKMSNRPMGNNTGWDIGLPEGTISALLSINLDSITDSSYTMLLEQIGTYPVSLTKTTTAGVVSWQLHKLGMTYDLYYNPDISDNTYQVMLTDTGNNGLNNTGHMQFRYIGHWQKAIGEANYYQTYDLDYTQTGAQGETLETISIVANDNANSRTPTIRIDAAKFRAYEYPVIEGSIDPASFKNNPATTISNIEHYGTQLIFGGNTYNVTDGNITMGTHQIPIRNMVLDSVPNADTLQYDNRINGTVVSTTANPSTIQFVGSWSANVSITSMDQTSYVKTEWQPGSFGWDGIDHNFLIVGLITSLGAFIGVGIYARRTKTGLWPLLIVCGGAAVLFFIML